MKFQTWETPTHLNSTRNALQEALNDACRQLAQARRHRDNASAALTKAFEGCTGEAPTPIPVLESIKALRETLAEAEMELGVAQLQVVDRICGLDAFDALQREEAESAQVLPFVPVEG